MMSVKDAAVEKIMLRMRIDKKASQALYKPEMDFAPDPPVVIWHPKIIVDFAESEDTVVSQAIVFWQDNLYMVSPNGQLVAESLDYVPQATNFGNRSTFGAGHHNVHVQDAPLLFSYLFCSEDAMTVPASQLKERN